MKTIWKWPLNPTSTRDIGFYIRMPPGAEVLTVQVEDGQPQIWALVDPDAGLGPTRTFRAYGTGHELPDEPGRYIGTFQLHDWALAFHVFEMES